MLMSIANMIVYERPLLIPDVLLGSKMKFASRILTANNVV